MHLLTSVQSRGYQIHTQMTFVAMFKLTAALPDYCECNDRDEIQATLLKRKH